MFLYLSYAMFGCVLYYLSNCLLKEGIMGVGQALITFLRLGVPGFEPLLQAILANEVKGAIKEFSSGASEASPAVLKHIPEHGLTAEEILATMEDLRSKDVSAEDGRLFAYVYTTEGDNHWPLVRKAFESATKTDPSSADAKALVQEAYNMFSHENGLNPFAFPSLRRFETEVISMTASMLNGDANVAGSLTSGGTESILCIMKAYRDRARKVWPHIKKPEVVAPITIHPAFNKAAAYFDLTMVLVPVDDNSQVDVHAMSKAITNNAVLLVGSAPQYPHAVVDPIEDIAALAKKFGLPLHVDACYGGFMLPWIERLGYPVPKWDFRVPEVTSISADLHKYGWGAKGASCALFRNAELRSHLIYAYTEWPGGLFASPSFAGTRPGGYIAASWATLMYMGQDGYLRKAKQVMNTCQKLQAAVNKIPELTVVGTPHMTGFALKSIAQDVNVLVVSDLLESKGWKCELQQKPATIHFSIMPHHTAVEDKLIADIQASVEQARGQKAPDGAAAMYGMTANIPDRSIVSDFLIKLLGDVYVCRE
eukprot:m.144066 g.144066  ORF g.144066 m.144066 type:complete len:538 (+) comp16186_c0_seq2:2741-4354(+)